MKKIIVSLAALLLFFFCLDAKTLSSEEAADYAKKFFNSPSVSLAWTSESSGSEPAFFVFNNAADGWVIISAEDATYPVLGYNRSGNFVSKNMPSHIRKRFAGARDEILSIRKAGNKQNPALRQVWENIGVRTKASEPVLLETAQWGQGSPYNEKCPWVDGESERSVTGCVATAMAIFIRYNSWPEKGKGTIEEYQFGIGSGPKKGIKYTVPSHSIEGKSYDYSKMPVLKNPEIWTEAEKNAVADLMYDCGTMVHMAYGENASSAYSANIIPALSEYMSYSKGACEVFRSSYNQKDWFDMLKKEIDANRPILYGGLSSEGGHQFILDGYDDAGFMHVNWGWEGIDNGWYMLNALGYKGMFFDSYDSASIGLSKDPEGKDKSNGEICFLQYNVAGTNFSGITLSSGQIKVGSKFDISVGALCNFRDDCIMYFKLCMVGKDGNIKYDLSKVDSVELKSQYVSAFTCKDCEIDIQPELGDHISMFQMLQDSTWRIVGNSGDFLDDAQKYVAQNSLGAFDVPMIYVKDSYKEGEVFFFNNLINGQKTIKSTSWFFDGNSNSHGCIKTTKGIHTATVKIVFTDDSTATLEQKIKVE